MSGTTPTKSQQVKYQELIESNRELSAKVDMFTGIVQTHISDQKLLNEKVFAHMQSADTNLAVINDRLPKRVADEVVMEKRFTDQDRKVSTIQRRLAWLSGGLAVINMVGVPLLIWFMTKGAS